MTEQSDESDAITEVLAAHRWRDILGDYEVAPYYKHFGCSCGWEQNIAGMNGWRSWVAAHEAHVAEQVERIIAARQAEVLRTVAAEIGSGPTVRVLVERESCDWWTDKPVASLLRERADRINPPGGTS